VIQLKDINSVIIMLESYYPMSVHSHQTINDIPYFKGYSSLKERFPDDTLIDKGIIPEGMINLTKQDVLNALKELLNPKIDFDFIVYVLSIIYSMRYHAQPLLADLWHLYDMFDCSLRDNICMKISISLTIALIEGEDSKAYVLMRDMEKKLQSFSKNSSE
jgi:hypothetical protein